MVNPITSIRNIAPTSESGIATMGMNTERKEPMKRKITTMTINSVSNRVVRISSKASLMYCVAS